MKFKGKSFIAIVLTPEPPYDGWFQEIDRIVARSPGFFIDRPIILDVRGRKIPIEDLEHVLEELKARSVRVMGIDGVAGTRLKEGMPPSFSGGRLTSDVEVPEPTRTGDDVESLPSSKTQQTASGWAKSTTDAENNDTGKNGASSKVAGQKANGEPSGSTDKKQAEPSMIEDGNSIVITEPVRSGQSILHPEGDVTVIGSVSSGAEVIAGGSIHVYGALRGRALAGVAGKDNARIFCTKLDAELVSINGLYKVADDFDGTLRNVPAQIRFENETLVFEELN